jgi:hypothetical protein
LTVAFRWARLRIPQGKNPMNSMTRVMFACVCLLALGACGTSTTDRALSGGAIGAGAGAVGGALVGSPATGALIGGAAGAAAGALTDSDDVDLGKPIWR